MSRVALMVVAMLVVGSAVARESNKVRFDRFSITVVGEIYMTCLCLFVCMFV